MTRWSWLAAALLGLGSGAAVAQSPALQIVVPYVPGGSADVIARTLAEELRGPLGKSVVVLNKPGASGMIGAETVARAKPDGATVLLGYTAEIAVNPALYPKITYRLEDFEPIALTGETPLILIGRKSLAATSFAELVAATKAPPGLNHGNAGAGSPAQFAGELLVRRAGMVLQQVPYKGSGQAVAEVVSGQLDLFFSGMAPVVPQLQAGTIKAYAVTGARRSSAAPDVPSLAELGLAGIDLPGWFALFAPAGTPRPIVQSLQDATLAALERPQVRAALALQGVDARPLRAAELRTFVAAEAAKYRALVAELGITADQ
jgi:tripartite-type tricarboxylate transporter receptor subunit TctC